MNELLDNQKIIKFLGNIEEDEPKYPPELMRARRKKFTKQMASICAVKRSANKHDRNQTITFGDKYRYTITKTWMAEKIH